MAGKRVSLASLAASKVEAVPGASRPDLIHVPPHTVAPTPLNPRRAFDADELVELGEDMRSGQLQPCVAVNKAAYLKLYPEHADQLPDTCRYVMAAGERRWRAAVKVGLDSLDLMLRHDLTDSRVRFLAAVLSENVQRANFNPIEEADGLRAMLDLHDGNQAAAARAMGKSKAWFNQRIGLLRLSDQMVQLVLEGKLTAFRDMRRYAALPPAEQYAAWTADQEQPRPVKPAPAGPAPAPAGDGGHPETYTAVYAPAGESRPQQAPGPVEQPVPPPAREPSRAPEVAEVRFTAASRQPAPREQPAPVPPQPAAAVPAAEGGERKAPRFPYENGPEAAQYLIHRMAPGEFKRMLDACNAHWEKQTANAS
ncbi:ParB/RepB/Spo0J family partition protein [Streptomyces prasinopilosus]|uniref:ParB/RepB/Spo0J family partition protein n=1 Tax=Streptomyces prasinopilosus TaxID=67344 RepID=UPI0006EBC292|nr:ParB/RepB/Spo0J family partition protein [Streptomyces prasinopilosus]